MFEEEKKSSIELQLAQLESEINDQLNQLQAELDYNFFPGHVGMKLASENLAGDFPVQSLISAVFTKTLTVEHVTSEKTFIVNPMRIIEKDAQQLIERCRSLGLYMTRVIIDMDGFLDQQPAAKYELLQALWEAFQLHLTAYRQEKEGKERAVSLVDYITHFDQAIKKNKMSFEMLAKSDVDHEQLAQFYSRLEAVVTQVNSLDQSVMVSRQEVIQIRDLMHQLIEIGFSISTPPDAADKFTRIQQFISDKANQQ